MSVFDSTISALGVDGNRAITEIPGLSAAPLGAVEFELEGRELSRTTTSAGGVVSDRET